MPYKNSSLNEHAFEQSMSLFWQKGYFNTAIDELVKTSGLSRAAIYKKFGGKEGFFVAMLERYRHNFTSQFLLPLRNQEQGLIAIFAFFEQFIELSEQGFLKNGCFFINTASELPCHQESTKMIIEAFFNELKTLLCEALERGKAQKQLSQSLDSPTCSSFLVANIFGLFTLARAMNNPALVREQVAMIKAFLHTYQEIP
ncbi:TPA: TetR/AcrR family transcriptional regulator [Legionella pneumophila]|nr:TetR family transcriptional regulator [Legionella pneumophila subsp. pneumophila]HAU0163545.1 TetR/AcrR family transcriptional regulator [Legionella pneumophila]HAT8868066.1 TetR family transcriptional regulator [Legionella pneumophila subsp. pneumophila]HAT9921636.1 TetR family transcriptional regulator [Legionella pneumophila subsp. pneumophila]HCJ1103062.1 TetR/AcrR family transcriptional regulator [Legionella pneumophila]